MQYRDRDSERDGAETLKGTELRVRVWSQTSPRQSEASKE